MGRKVEPLKPPLLPFSVGPEIRGATTTMNSAQFRRRVLPWILLTTSLFASLACRAGDPDVELGAHAFDLRGVPDNEEGVVVEAIEAYVAAFRRGGWARAESRILVQFSDDPGASAHRFADASTSFSLLGGPTIRVPRSDWDHLLGHELFHAVSHPETLRLPRLLCEGLADAEAARARGTWDEVALPRLLLAFQGKLPTLQLILESPKGNEIAKAGWSSPFQPLAPLDSLDLLLQESFPSELSNSNEHWNQAYGLGFALAAALDHSWKDYESLLELSADKRSTRILAVLAEKGIDSVDSLRSWSRAEASLLDPIPWALSVLDDSIHELVSPRVSTQRSIDSLLEDHVFLLQVDGAPALSLNDSADLAELLKTAEESSRAER